MSERDSLRDVLGAHLDRAKADAEAERKAAAMLERPALQARLEGVAALGDGARAGAVASERSEHVVVSPHAAALPDRSTQRRVAIDPRFDPRLLVTQVKAAGPTRRGPLLLGLAVLLTLGLGAWWWSRRATVNDTPAPATRAAPPLSAGADTPPAPDENPAPTSPTTPPAESASPASSSPQPATAAAPPSSASASPPPSAEKSARPAAPPSAPKSTSSASSPPAASSGYKPLGGNGPVF